MGEARCVVFQESRIQHILLIPDATGIRVKTWVLVEACGLDFRMLALVELVLIFLSAAAGLSLASMVACGRRRTYLVSAPFFLRALSVWCDSSKGSSPPTVTCTRPKGGLAPMLPNHFQRLRGSGSKRFTRSIRQM